MRGKEQLPAAAHSDAREVTKTKSLSWDNAFAFPLSWPGLTVGMSRDIFKREQKIILACAEHHSFRVLGASKGDPYAEKFHQNVIDFIKVPT